MTVSDWLIKYDTIETGKRSYGQESLMTLGNGYLGWRGAPVWAQYSENHYPGLYVAGVFNRTHTEVAGHDVENEDMVNLPNPQLIKLYINDKFVDFDANTVARESVIDFKQGIQHDKFVAQVEEGQLTLITKKFVDPTDFHQLAIEGEIVADFDARLKMESLIDGSILNQNVERYRAFDSKEFTVQSTSNHILLAHTRTTDLDLVVGVTTRLEGELLVAVESTDAERLVEATTKELHAFVPVHFEKLIAVATSYESEEPLALVEAALESAELSSIKDHNAKYWANVWEHGDIVVDSENEDLQRMVRMNIFHIRQAAQHQANQYLDASVGSRALTGEGYRGHIFWDEIFVLPYYAANEAETARDLLRYRITRLEAALANAKVDDEVGAMFPWQAGLDGDEQSQFVHLNTVNNEWEPDNSRRQRHVSLAIIYNLWIYLQLTEDESILNEGGLDLLIETSKFWLNKAELGEDGRYHIAGVMGPDEYHEAYPGEEGGITDNAYTNLMLVWQLNWLKELKDTGKFDFSALGDELLNKAEAVSQKLFLDLNEDGIIAQYAGYFDLKEVDFAAYEARFGDIHRIDRLMKAEGVSPDEYKVAKQADTLMTIYNLGASHMEKLIQQLGYQLPDNWLKLNRDYYLERTVHGSTTSRPVFAGIDVSLGELDEALDFLNTAIGSDYYDIQGGTTAEGVHIGVMGETLEVIQNEFAGVSLRDGEFSIAPSLPTSWSRLAFSQLFRGARVALDITADKLHLTADRDLSVKVYGEVFRLTANQTQVFELK